MKPANMGTGMVVGQFGMGVGDGPDEDRDPEVIPLSGSITFTPSVPYLPNQSARPNPIMVFPAPIRGVLDEEGYLCTPSAHGSTPQYRGVRLFATDDPDMSVQDWTYSVTYRFDTVKGVTPVMKAHSMSVPEGSVIDLTKVVEVPSSPGVGTPQALALLAQAEAAAANAGLAAASAEAVALQLRADANAGAFKGEPGPAGPNTVPTDNAVAANIQNPATATGAALSAAIAPKLDKSTATATYATKASVTAELDSRVTPLVAAAIAADPTVASAAAAAVDANPKIATIEARSKEQDASLIVFSNGYSKPPAASSTDANTLGLWHIDNNLTDSSGAGRTLAQYSTLAGSYSTIARFGTASLGGGIYQNVGVDALLSSTGADGGTLLNGTVECWVKSIPHTGQKVAISHRNWFWLGMSAKGTAVAKYGSGVNEKTLTGTTVISGDAITTAPWHHLSLVFDNGTARLYVDGKVEASSTTPTTAGAETGGGFTVGGLRTVRDFDWWVTSGRIDEVRVSSTPRYAAEGAYPARPVNLRAGAALYIGPILPEDRQPFDQWLKTETI